MGNDREMNQEELMEELTEEQTEEDKVRTEKRHREKKVRKHPVLRVILIIFLVIVLLAMIGFGVAYWIRANYFKDHFLPNVSVNGMDCSYLDADTVISMIEEQSMVYSLTVIGQYSEELGVLSSENMGLTIDVRDDVENLLAQQEWIKWLWAYWDTDSHNITYSVSYDADMILETLSQWEGLQEENMEIPQDAYLSEYQSETKSYEVIPETEGSLLNLELVLAVIEEAISAGQTTVNLDETDCYIRAEVTAEDEDLLARAEQLNTLVSCEIIYDWNGAEVILDGDTIHEWIVEEDGEISIDEDAVAAFVDENASANDTYGKSKKFKTTLGVTLTLPNGGYGWKTNRTQETEELLAMILAGESGEREPVYSVTAAHKGQNDIGSSYVEIDLTNQHLYLYISGSIVLESDFVSGKVSSGNTTPAGVFALTYKTTNAVLRGADYETPVSYWMPFNGNIGMHDATWRSSFGGDIYLTNGSHGCINLPLESAAAIYSYVYAGFPVICYYY